MSWPSQTTRGDGPRHDTTEEDKAVSFTVSAASEFGVLRCERRPTSLVPAPLAEAPPPETVVPSSAPNNCKEGHMTTDQKWRSELAKLTGLVKDMMEQQAMARREMLQLHNEQQKGLKAALSRLESSAPRCDGPGSEKPTVPTREPTEKSAARQGKSASEASTYASQVSHPCAVQDPAEAVATVPAKAVDAAVSGEGPESVQLSGESRIWRRRLSEESRLWRMRTSMTSIITTAWPVEIYNKAKRFLELARASPRKKGNITTLQSLVRSFYFQAIVSAVIQVNAICIGCQVDSQLKKTYQGKVVEEDVWEHVDIVFNVFFALELIIRVAADRWDFIFGENVAWNLLDCALVLEPILALALEQSAAPDISFVRILRLLRVTRVLRILRAMRACQTLRVMVLSIVKSMASLFWVFVLILFVIYFFAVLFSSGIVASAEYQLGSMPDSIAEKYGSITDVMLSLFMCISGGDDWSVMVTPLYDVDVFYVALFVVYIFFMAFGVLNVVVANFVDNAANASLHDRESVVNAELKQEREYCLKMRRIFNDADTDEDGQLTWTEFEEYLSDSTTAAYFSTAGLDANIARTLFRLLDVDDTDKVGIDEFVGGCLRLKGGARSIDVNMLLYETEKMCYKLTEFMEGTTKALHKTISDPARRRNGPGTPTSEGDSEGTSPVESPAMSRASSGLSKCTAFRRRSTIRPCAALAGSEVIGYDE